MVVGPADLVEHGEDFDLRLHLLGHGLDDQVGFARGLLDRRGIFQAGESVVGAALGDLAQLNRLVEIGADFVFRLAQRGRKNVFEDGAIAAQRGGVRNAAAHDAGADDGDGADLGHRLLSLFQLLDDVDEIGIGLAHVLGQSLLLFGYQIEAGVDAAQGCRDVVDVVHHANQFTSGCHNSPFNV